jgi:hypothetical protein
LPFEDIGFAEVDHHRVAAGTRRSDLLAKARPPGKLSSVELIQNLASRGRRLKKHSLCIAQKGVGVDKNGGKT